MNSELAVLTAYTGIAFFVAAPILLRSFKLTEPGKSRSMGDDFPFAVIGTFVLAVIWPVFGPFFVAWWLARREWHAPKLPKRKQKKGWLTHEEELELEKRLGIPRPPE